MKKAFVSLVVLILFVQLPLFAQATNSALDLKSSRILHQTILKTIKNEIKEKYYDANMHGIDIEANAAKARDLIASATSVDEMTDIIARFLYPFDDSHLYFLPPSRTIAVDYGWEMTFIGDKVFVTQVDDDSDAKKKGVRVGDQIYMIEGYIPSRSEFTFLRYHFNILRPQSKLKVILIKPSGNKYQLDLNAKITEDSAFMPSTRDLTLQEQRQYDDATKQLFYGKIPKLSIWKMPNFGLTPAKVDKMIDKVGKDDALILDLRSNGGGYLASLAALTANFFDRAIKVGTIKERTGTKTIVIPPRDKNPYTGKLVVLIDSDSASASEIFARLIQLEKRGTVIGDQSMGAVMQSQHFYHDFGLDSKVPYGVSITVADIIMQDGQRLEKIGVAPDEKILPTAQDLANRRDPAMARAMKVLGFDQTPEQAGAIFPEQKK